MTQQQIWLVLILFAIALIGARIINSSLLILILIAIGGWLIWQYNTLQAQAQEIQEAHSNIMASMKKRVDLANKLVDITSSYGDHEKLTHISVAQAESSPSGTVASSAQVNSVLKGVIAVARAYPELQANQTYQMLMQQLEQLESNLQSKREGYNAKVRAYNSSRSSFPTALFADQLGFRPAPYFDVENSDALENLKNFQTDDGAILRKIFAGVGSRVYGASQTLATEIGNATKQLPTSQNAEQNSQNTDSEGENSNASEG